MVAWPASHRVTSILGEGLGREQITNVYPKCSGQQGSDLENNGNLGYWDSLEAQIISTT